MSKKKISEAEKFGSKGGKTTLKRYGKKYFSELAKKRWKKSKQKNNPTKNEDKK